MKTIPLILLLGAVRMSAATIALIDDFSHGAASVALTGRGTDSILRELCSGSLFCDGTMTMEVDSEYMPDYRSVRAEVSTDFSRYFLAIGPGAQANATLRYDAPQDLCLDLTMGGQADAFAFDFDFSQTPVRMDIAVETLDDGVQVIVVEHPGTSSGSRVILPQELFDNVNLARANSVSVRISRTATGGAPDLILSGISLISTKEQVVPEPSVALTMAIGLMLTISKRTRKTHS